jgi:hypothetical protein
MHERRKNFRMLFELNGNANVLLLQKENNIISFEMTMKWQ